MNQCTNPIKQIKQQRLLLKSGKSDNYMGSKGEKSDIAVSILEKLIL